MGALQIAPDEVLKTLGRKITCKAEHDLEMFVKAVFWRCHLPDYTDILAEKSPERLLAFWNRWLALPPWPRLVGAARACDYDTVGELLHELLPRHVVVSGAS
jgi:hypothetical protein